METLNEQFMEMAGRAGAEVQQCAELGDAITFIAEKAQGVTLVPETPLAKRHALRQQLQAKGVQVHEGSFREAGQITGAGVTFCNFAMADTGTVVLESTDEEIRLATTLPERHFVILDPATILEDNLAAVEIMTSLHSGSEPRFVAYITGPSRTADIERVLTIGCHGPRELYLLLVDGVSSELLEI